MDDVAVDTNDSDVPISLIAIVINIIHTVMNNIDSAILTSINIITLIIIIIIIIITTTLIITIIIIIITIINIYITPVYPEPKTLLTRPSPIVRCKPRAAEWVGRSSVVTRANVRVRGEISIQLYTHMFAYDLVSAYRCKVISYKSMVFRRGEWIYGLDGHEMLARW